MLEKRCAKFLCYLFNSENVLFSRICRYSVYNSDTTMGENIRYFMYKYNISYNIWYGNLSNIYVKIDTHVRSITNYNNVNYVKPTIVVSHNSFTLPNLIA